METEFYDFYEKQVMAWETFYGNKPAESEAAYSYAQSNRFFFMVTRKIFIGKNRKERMGWKTGYLNE